MKKIIFINYQKVIPFFMQMELGYADKLLDEVYYISRELTDKKKAVSDFPKVKIITTNRLSALFNLFRLPFVMLKKEYRAQLKAIKRDKLFSKQAFIHVLKYAFCTLQLKAKCKKIIKRSDAQDTICAVSCWFSEPAFIASKLKKEFPNIKAYSFAHAYEVDPGRNKYLNYTFNDFKYQYLDGVLFSSVNMMNNYINLFSDKAKELMCQKSEVIYLGVKKDVPSNNPKKCDQTFNIVSCSGINWVKRVHLICEALKDWKVCKIKWTHIGLGPLADEIREKAQEVVKANANVEINLAGSFENKQVKEYYANNYVDLFLNVSCFEGLPVSVMEALIYGIPVMAPSIGGITEVVNYENGEILPVELTGEILREKLEQYYKLTEEQKERKREKAFLMGQQKCDAEKNVLEFFNRILNN